MTHNPKAAILQFFDVLMVKAVWVNYMLQLDEPCNPQRYIELLVQYKSIMCFSVSPIYRSICLLRNHVLNRHRK